MRKILRHMTPEYLYEQNVVLGKSQREIARENNCSETSVHHRMKKCGLLRDVKADYTGETFGFLEVLAVTDERDANSHRIAECRCHRCGRFCRATICQLASGDKVSCGCMHGRIGSESPTFQGHGQISLSYWHSIQRGAEARNLPFEVSFDYIWELYNRQNGLCALSGTPIFFHSTCKSRWRQTASLDRIDSKKGYIEGNIQWVHKGLNFMKRNVPEIVFLNWCRLISQHRFREPMPEHDDMYYI